MNWPKLIFNILILAVVVLGLFFYSSLITRLLLAMVLAYLLDPAVTWMEHKKVPRWLSVIIVYIVVAGLLTLAIGVYAPKVIKEANQFLALLSQTDQAPLELIKDLPIVRPLRDIVTNLNHRVPQIELSDKFDHLLEQIVARVGDFPQMLVSNYQPILGALAMIFMIPMFGFFLISDKKRIRRGLMSLIPNKYFEISIILMRKVDESVGNYLRAVLLEMLAVGAMSSITLSVLGVPYAIVVGIIAGLTNVIPYIGPWLGGIIAALVIIVSGLPPVNIIWMGIGMLGVQFVDNYVVYPAIIGKTMKMHPFLVILTVLAGSYFGGVIWMLISVPLVHMVFSLVSALHKNLKEFRII
ncbi:MAG: AI-2E family transporter [Candidatus Cloacimonadaceae bacterium]|jgi:predicted PurR-regulated permease PerM|nr:AI-2E family transporter [Candidatus Cloacimonadota bacterium]MDX9950144.1 AI-2E family transporter [Candidatus Syntrophosphaera sp.]NLN85594.1 AI-2E family transporter [Candidatus Cloacimonadota bacterium]